MKIKRKIKIIIVLSVAIILGLVVIGISAHDTISQRQQYQKETICPNTSNCPQPYCNSEIISNWNSQIRSCCR